MQSGDQQSQPDSIQKPVQETSQIQPLNSLLPTPARQQQPHDTQSLLQPNQLASSNHSITEQQQGPAITPTTSNLAEVGNNSAAVSVDVSQAGEQQQVANRPIGEEEKVLNEWVHQARQRVKRQCCPEPEPACGCPKPKPDYGCMKEIKCNYACFAAA
jgi:hypothetical protein